MVSLKKLKKPRKNQQKQWFERLIGVTEKLKTNKFYRILSYIFRKLFWFLLIATLVYQFILFYGNRTEINEKDTQKIKAYEAVLSTLKPATPLIDQKRRLILDEIETAKSDDKITVSEFVKIEGMYKSLENTLMDLVLVSLDNKANANQVDENSVSQDKGK